MSHPGVFKDMRTDKNLQASTSQGFLDFGHGSVVVIYALFFSESTADGLGLTSPKRNSSVFLF